MYFQSSTCASFSMFEQHQHSINRAKLAFQVSKGLYKLSCWLCMLVSLYTLLYECNLQLRFQLEEMVLTSWCVVSWFSVGSISNKSKYSGYWLYNLLSWIQVGMKMYVLYLMLGTSIQAWFVSHSMLVGLILQNIFVHCMYDMLQFSCWMYSSIVLDELIPIRRVATQPRFNL